MTLDDDKETISEGPTSIVTRTESKSPDGPRYFAVKTSTTTHAIEPHDIIKEVRLFATLSHPNIVPLIKHESHQSQYLSLWMPYIPYSLDELLHSSRFSPHPIISFEPTTSTSPTPREVRFVVLVKSIIFQVLSGVSYLHSERVQIAHRDIKPSNVLLTPSCCAQLIDFGIAFHVGEDRAAKARDLWPESVARMYFEVSTGPYRAPELLFGPRTYDAFAIDAWSFGTTFAECFTPLRLQTDDEDEDDASSHQSESESESGAGPRPPTPPPPFIIPRGKRLGVPTGRWRRASLFDGTRGDIGLAWSIFKICGTPTAETWPSFQTLPDAGKLTFVDVPGTDLATHLPNLPPTTSSSPPGPSSALSDIATNNANADPTPLDLIRRCLVYEPARRRRPAEALAHPWFSAAPGLVLPVDWAGGVTVYPGSLAGTPAPRSQRSFTVEGQTRTLGDLLMTYVASREH